jgi:transcriptional regulator with XRE-family HTH domain
VGAPPVKHTNEKNHKYDVIRLAGMLFNLTAEETESLANKVGLSLAFCNNFNNRLQELILQTGFTPSVLCKRAGVSERMYQYIKRGKIPTKETLIALALSMNLDKEAIQELLNKAGYILSDSLPNDAIILWALKNKSCNIDYINSLFGELNLPLLMTREKFMKSQD